MPKRTDEQIVAEHRARYSTQRGLLAKAEASVRYWSKRAGWSHGKEMLQAAVARRALRRRNVAAELRIIERHRPEVDSVSNAGLAEIAGSEGFRAKAYPDPATGGEPWTIGYGETQGVRPGQTTTRAAALKRLIARVNHDYLAPVLRYCRSVGFEPKQGQADALASLAYNLGPGIFKRGTAIGEAVASGDRMRIANAFRVYDKAGRPPRRMLGLTLRRGRERKTFLNAK
jgi:lysozyme